MRGDKLRELREKHKITRKKLAEMIYVTESIIQSWEEGCYLMFPSSGEISEMAEIFEMEEEDLREYIEHEEINDWDKNDMRFIDYVDWGLGLCQEIKGSDYFM